MSRREARGRGGGAPRLRAGLTGALAGVLWGVLVFGGGLIVVSQFAPSPVTGQAVVAERTNAGR